MTTLRGQLLVKALSGTTIVGTLLIFVLLSVWIVFLPSLLPETSLWYVP